MKDLIFATKKRAFTKKAKMKTYHIVNNGLKIKCCLMLFLLTSNMPTILNADHTFYHYPNYGDGSDGSITVEENETKYTDNTRAEVIDIVHQQLIGTTVLFNDEQYHGQFEEGDIVMFIDMKPDKRNVGCNESNYVITKIQTYSECIHVCDNYPEYCDFEPGEGYKCKYPGFLAGLYLNELEELRNRADDPSNIQAIKIPQYKDVILEDGGVLTCNEYDGHTGGILSFWVDDESQLIFEGGKINASGKGYRGGEGGQNYGEEVPSIGSKGEKGSQLQDGEDASPVTGGIGRESELPDSIFSLKNYCQDEVIRVGGRGGFGGRAAGIEWGESGESPWPTHLQQICASNWEKRLLIPGWGGSGGSAGNGPGNGGHGSGGGGGHFPGEDGDEGDEGVGYGGIGGNGGDGAAAIYIRAYDVVNNSNDPNERIVLTKGVDGEDGTDASQDGKGGDGGDGGDGGAGYCDEDDGIYPAGNGGLGGPGGLAPQGGSGGSGGFGGSIWFFYASGNAYNEIDEENNFLAVGGEGGSGGSGGDHGHPGDDGIKGESGSQGNDDNIPDEDCLDCDTNEESEYRNYVETIISEFPFTTGFANYSGFGYVGDACGCAMSLCNLLEMEPEEVRDEGPVFRNPDDPDSYCLFDIENNKLKCYEVIEDPDNPEGSEVTLKGLSICEFENDPGGPCNDLINLLHENGFDNDVSCEDGLEEEIVFDVEEYDEPIVFSMEEGAFLETECEVSGNCQPMDVYPMGDPGVDRIGIEPVETFYGFSNPEDVYLDGSAESGLLVTDIGSSVETENMLGIYPNPANNKINIDLTIDQKEKANIRIYDSNGRVVYEEDEVSLSKNKSKALDTGFLNPGQYTLQLKFGERSKPLSQKFIITE